jgi:hypothetical protein
MIPKQYEIYWDPTKGSEMNKIRPCGLAFATGGRQTVKKGIHPATFCIPSVTKGNPSVTFCIPYMPEGIPCATFCIPSVAKGNPYATAKIKKNIHKF